jgi:hypothetical protein
MKATVHFVGLLLRKLGAALEGERVELALLVVRQIGDEQVRQHEIRLAAVDVVTRPLGRIVTGAELARDDLAKDGFAVGTILCGKTRWRRRSQRTRPQRAILPRAELASNVWLLLR